MCLNLGCCDTLPVANPHRRCRRWRRARVRQRCLVVSIKAHGRKNMRNYLFATCVSAVALCAAGAAYADDPLIAMQKDAKQWITPRADYAATGYSALNQINTQNVGKIAPGRSRPACFAATRAL